MTRRLRRSRLELADARTERMLLVSALVTWRKEYGGLTSKLPSLSFFSKSVSKLKRRSERVPFTIARRLLRRLMTAPSISISSSLPPVTFHKRQRCMTSMDHGFWKAGKVMHA
jgi:hypothetical protein